MRQSVGGVKQGGQQAPRQQQQQPQQQLHLQQQNNNNNQHDCNGNQDDDEQQQPADKMSKTRTMAKLTEQQDSSNLAANGAKRKSAANSATAPAARKRERKVANVEQPLVHHQEHQQLQQMQPQQQPQNKADKEQQENICAACGKPIRERYLLVALDKRWHEDCLKCACCDCRLGEVGSSLFTHSDKILCRRDFLRIFGQHGHCAACKKSIPPYELVMRAGDNAYHMDCFACQQCQYRFCVGDQFHLGDQHRIVCILCHQDQQQQSAAPTPQPPFSTSVALGDHQQQPPGDLQPPVSPAGPPTTSPTTTTPATAIATPPAAPTATTTTATTEPRKQTEPVK